MQEKTPEIVIDYYSDVLCVWAWIAQPRLDEIARQWGPQVVVRHRFLDIFGDSRKKIPARWGEHDGFERFAEHVQHSAQAFDYVSINPKLWHDTRPRSSMQAHLMLRAIGCVADEQAVASTALRIRKSLFGDAMDVSDMDLLLELARLEGVDGDALRQSLRDGSAMAALSSDLRDASDLSVRGSPTWVLNHGRQILYGNVGYRVLSANIEELLRQPGQEASWC